MRKDMDKNCPERNGIKTPVTRYKCKLLAVNGLKGARNVHLDQSLVLGEEPVIGFS